MDESPLHALWGKAKDHPDYDKEQWMELQRKFWQLKSEIQRLRREVSRE